jgi:hypothetical protein
VWQKRLQALEETVWFFRLAFPDCDHTPTETAQGGGAALVAGDISLELFAPPSAAGFWQAGGFALAVKMPEAPVHKNANAVARENDIGVAGKIAAVEPEPVAHRMQDAANGQLRLGVFPANPAHHATAFLWTQSVYHSSKSCPGFG